MKNAKDVMLKSDIRGFMKAINGKMRLGRVVRGHCDR